MQRITFRTARGRIAGIFVFLLAVTVSSCGYRLSGSGDLVPAGARTIAVPVVINATREPYVDVSLTRAVTEEFLADGRLQVVALDGADLALRCRIAAFELTALSYTPDSFLQQVRVRIVVDAVLEDRSSKRILWQENGIDSSLIADYSVGYVNGSVTIGQTKINRQAAIEKASRALAQTLRSRVLEGF